MKTSLATLPGNQLLERLQALVRRGNAVEAELLAHLAEVDARKLYLEQACSSMFAYCQRVLRFAEGVAYKRIQAARAARRFPEVLAAVRSGELHVTGVSLLAPRLDANNVAELIHASRNRSADEIRRLLADREPRPDVPASVRRVATPTPAPARTPVDSPLLTAGAPSRRVTEGRSAPVDPAPRARSEPLGGARYHVQFTADRALYEQLQELRALMRHQVPNGDLGEILSRAVALLLKEVRKRKFAATSAPRRARPANTRDGRPSRHIPADIRRSVWKRDGGRCTYVSPGGRRCGASEFVEFDHVETWARTREHSLEAITLRCRAHNQLRAREDFGERHVAAVGKQARRGADRSRSAPDGRCGQLDSDQVHGEPPAG